MQKPPKSQSVGIWTEALKSLVYFGHTLPLPIVRQAFTLSSAVGNRCLPVQWLLLYLLILAHMEPRSCAAALTSSSVQSLSGSISFFFGNSSRPTEDKVTRPGENALLMNCQEQWGLAVSLPRVIHGPLHVGYRRPGTGIGDRYWRFRVQNATWRAKCQACRCWWWVTDVWERP